ncbi:MAG: cupredoxin domain-containing protein [Planctomycetia bacterium]|nr:cupredoxin domain-containing protein [Planctomycetia bacterium]
MKIIKFIFVAIIFLACTILPIAASLVYEAHRTKDLTLEILTRAPERGNFLPRKVTVPVGEPVRLRVRNVDTVTHGFAIPELGVHIGEVKAGRVALVEFTPEKVGRFDFYCTVWCSDNHLQMRGVIEVVQK